MSTMLSFRIIQSLQRLAINHPNKNALRQISNTPIKNIQLSAVVCAEPMKKKKKMDPAIIKAREERKKKKIEKQIRRLEKNARTLKPIDECEIPMNLIDERDKRTRQVTDLTNEEYERRALLEKKWANYKLSQHLADLKMMDRILFSQQKALDELRAESEELYQEAIQIDCQLIPFKRDGPTETPPIDSYNAPDGDYHDVSKKWD